MGAWGRAAEALITIGIWAKVIMWGGSFFFLLQKWNLGPFCARQNESKMGISGSKMTILRPCQDGVWSREFRVFEAMPRWGREQTRTAGKQRERDRVREREREREREIPDFPKPPAPALRFGSMNPISRV